MGDALTLVLPNAVFWAGGIGLSAFYGRRPMSSWNALVVLLVGFAALSALAARVFSRGPIGTVAGDWPQGVGIRLRADPLGVSFALLSVLVLILAVAYEAIGRTETRVFPALALFLAAGLTGLFLTADAFNFYVFFELSMISAYVLTAFGGRLRQLRAAVIFAVVNLVGSVLFLLGIVALYHVTGSLDMSDIARRMTFAEQNPAILSGTLLFVAFGVKLGLFPFHFWLPAVYTGVRPSVAAILSGALANIGTYGLLRFGGEMLPRELHLAAPALIALGAASILYGGFQAVGRVAPEEVIAYSAIGQVGYVLIALAIGGGAGYAAAILFAFINALNKTLLFLAIDLRGAFVGPAVAIGALSVAGAPPVAGFFGKAALFRVGLTIGDGTERVAIVALIAVGGALSLLYMFQAFGRRYLDAHGEARRRPSSAGRRRLVGAVAVLLLAFGCWPEPLIALSERAAAVLPGRLP
jgi:multicomponent Na+:H+ antiporter subunit D